MQLVVGTAKALDRAFAASICVARPLFKRVYQKINFRFSQQNHMLLVLRRTVSFEHPKHMLKLWIRKYIQFHIVNRLDMVSYKSVYSLCIIIKPAILKAPPSTILLFPAAIEQRHKNLLSYNFWVGVIYLTLLSCSL